ncbi:MAG: malate dehydrogenase, partial [Caulobacterales bacterium]|nr:malate dehydrogenase [Caulobacterales bacterium]
KRVMPCAVEVKAGTYGQATDVFAGVPVVIGAGGIERIVEIGLDAEEQAGFDRSADAVRALVKVAQGLMAQ